MKCVLCGKEFQNETDDFILVQHFINEHNKEVKNIGKDILKAQKAKKGNNRKVNKSLQHIVNLSNDNQNKPKDMKE